MGGLFYSLVIHLRLSLGKFPQSIGNDGFSAALKTHGSWTYDYCSVLTGLSLITVPIALLVSFGIRRWRRFVLYPLLHGLAIVASWGLMLLAPPPFLNWWFD